MGIVERILEFQDRTRLSEVTSGETRQLEELTGDWKSLYEEKEEVSQWYRGGTVPEHPSETFWTYEQVFENPGPFFDAVSRQRVIPRYKYVINYLLIHCMVPMSRKHRKAYWDFLEEARLEQIPAMLSGKVKRRFEENGFSLRPADKTWELYFSKLIKQFQYGYLRDLALGFHMEIQDLDVFLNKVLKRSRMNFYEKEEAFLYLVLKCGGDRRYFDAFGCLKELYGKTQPLDAEKKIPEGFDVHTQTVGMILDRQLDTALDRLPIGFSIFDTEDEALRDYFNWTDWLRKSGKKRTTKEEFQELLKELRENLSDSTEFIRYRVDQKYLSLKQKYESQDRKALTVWYESDRDIILPKQKYKTVEVKVRAVSSAREYEKLKALKGWRNNPQFVKPEHISEGFQAEDPILQSRIRSIAVGSKVRFFARGEKDIGTLEVTYSCQAFFPEGTVLTLEENGFLFRFAVSETMERRPFSEEKIEVLWTNRAELMKKKEAAK